MTEGTHPEASFGHLMGYDAGYYGYMWSKVYAEDMASRFQEEGLLDPVTGRRYRETILERGSSRDEAELLRDFLGRAPSEEAFLKSLGL
jgi:thimet oligopeptidase